jgi:hypothetical protein
MEGARRLTARGRGAGGGVAEARFWAQYLELLSTRGVRQPSARWYTLRAEQYIGGLPDRSLKTHTPSDVERYFHEAGREARLLDWQFRQIVDAVHALFNIVRLAWFGDFDWDYWRDSARALPADHPTILRDAAGRRPPGSGDGIRFRDV